jgi:hypothetical protein
MHIDVGIDTTNRRVITVRVRRTRAEGRAMSFYGLVH